MKNLYKVIAVFIISAFVISCSKENDSETANVKFVSSLANGDIMTKATNQEVFGEFYSAIINGTLAADSYHLILTEVGGDVRYEFYGSWKSSDFVTVKTGRYHVKGVSTASGDYLQDKCSLVFNDIVDISAHDSTISIEGNYDCYLLIFDTNQVSTVVNFTGVENLEFFDFSHYKYAFVNDTIYDIFGRDIANINGTNVNGSNFIIKTGYFPFVKGMHYVFSPVNSEFYVPEMEDGWDEHGNTNYSNEFDTVSNGVDLGLSVEWAEWNLGANANYEYGALYGMGDPTGLNHGYDGYFFNNESICGTDYDLARVKWGDEWRLPNRTELDELVKECTWASDNVNGVDGVRATGPNGNSIFFPYAGDRNGEDYFRVGEEVHIWTGTPYCTYHKSGYYDIDAKHGMVTQNDGCPSYVGQTIRPVREIVTYCK